MRSQLRFYPRHDLARNPRTCLATRVSLSHGSLASWTFYGNAAARFAAQGNTSEYREWGWGVGASPTTTWIAFADSSANAD